MLFDKISALLRQNYRTAFAVVFLMLVFYYSKHQSYVLFHTFVELFSIVVAFAVFIVTWNSRRMQDNHFLHLVGISYIFIGALDLLHTLTFKGMNVIQLDGFPANQFWVATRFLEALTFITGLWLINRPKKMSSDLIFLIYFIVSLILIFSIFWWKNFPVCFVDGQGQTTFKVYAEYIVIGILLLAGYLLMKHRHHFSKPVYNLLLASMVFTILSEFCFTLYISNHSTANELGHYAKLIAFFLIYKANVEIGFIRPTDLIFKNLKDSEEKYRTLAESLPGLILRFDQELNCIYSNLKADSAPSAESFLKDEKNLLELLTPIVHKTRETGLIQLSSFQAERGGTQYYAVQVIPEYAEKNEEGSFLVICQDVTTLKEAEQELHGLNQTKDKLFSIIAHDLKNPFNSLLSFSELILKNAQKLERDKIEHMAKRMNDSAKRAYALLENLLNWSRVQTGLLKPVPLPIAVNDLFVEATQLMGAMAQTKDIDLIFKNADDLFVMADRQMAETILRNLVSNALKFSYTGSKVCVSAHEMHSMIVFSIQDQGVGISKENSMHLFDVGNTFSTPGTAAERGTGLGLVLCREFVELNGGKIWLESELGKGTTFYFSLPAA